MPELHRPGFDRIDLAVLAAILRSDLEAVEGITRNPSFDPDRFAAFASDHQLAGLVHSIMEGTPVQTVFSVNARERLAGAFLRQWATNERLAQELREITHTLDTAGCPFILLKGLHTAIAYWGSADRRGMSDLDILVRKNDVARAIAVLEKHGYTRGSRALLGWRVASVFTHACELERNDTPLDLHWTLVNHPSYRIDYDEIWRRRRPFDADGARVHVLDDEHALTFQLLAIAKDLELGTVTLKAFADLYAITRAFDATAAWPEFFAARAREGTARTAAAVLSLMLAIIDTTGRFPGLATCLDQIPSPTAPPELIERIATRRRSFGDRLWALRLYETSAVGTGAWWAVSLPFRVAAHRIAHPPGATR